MLWFLAIVCHVAAVVATCSAGVGATEDASSPSSITGLSLLEPVGETWVTIQWRAIVQGERYSIETRIADSLDEFKVHEPYFEGSRYTISGLATYVTYEVRVRTLIGDCPSGQGVTLFATPVVPPQSAIKEVSFSNLHTTSFEVSWMHTVNATKYNVYMRKFGEKDFILVSADVQTQSTLVSGLDYGQVYDLLIEPGNSAGYNPQAAIKDTQPTEPRNTLVQLFSATGGNSWTNKNNWNSELDICRWNGVVCSSSGVTCVCTQLTSLLLQNNNLVGTLPTDIGRLTDLVILNLAQNSLSSSLPSQVGKMTQLSRLLISDNLFVDEPPTEIGRLSSLRRLELARNGFVGRIPVQWGQLSQLTSLDLEANKFFFTLTPLAESGAFTKWSGLRNLRLNQNRFSGVIPSELALLTQLTSLDISSNDFFGTLSPQLRDSVAPFQSLTFFSCQNTFIDTDFECSCASTLSCSSTQCPLTIGAGGVRNCQPLNSVTQVTLLKNLFTATGGAQWTTKTGWNNGVLTTLCDTSVDLQLSIIYGIDCQFGVVRSINLRNNNLQGALIDDVGKITTLVKLDFANNKLTGTIPASYGELASLTSLDLSNNQISGTFPAQAKFLFSAVTIAVNNNKLTGSLPPFIGSNPLEQILLQSNQFSGSLPPHFSVRNPALKIINIQSNRFDGTLPDSLVDLAQLQQLLVSSNNITGCLPQGFKLSVLQKITCSDTYIFQSPSSSYIEALDSASCSPFRSFCGDGSRTPFEGCDDGNAVSGVQDGCTADCQVQPGWICADGTPFGGLSDWIDFDDLMVFNATDGCEFGYYNRSKSRCREVCGNGIRTTTEVCDDGNTNNRTGGFDDGCSADCKQQRGWECSGGLGATSICRERCGNGVRTNGPLEGVSGRCDTGLVPSPGCVSCVVQRGFVCTEDAQGKSTCEEKCGDGFLTLKSQVFTEECDDGNLRSGDGCSSNCKIETGWECNITANRSICGEKCGNALTSDNEQCDGGIGCDDDCFELPGYECTVNQQRRSTCRPICGPWQPRSSGNRQSPYRAGTYKAPEEQCDDGNTDPLDGCANCRLGRGWSCTSDAEPSVLSKFGILKPSSCVTTCGDGIIVRYKPPNKTTGGEECDVPTTRSGPRFGCTGCKIEKGWKCTFRDSTTGQTSTDCIDVLNRGISPNGVTASQFVLEEDCGNGLITAGEECDDGRRAEGPFDDGCDSSCKVQIGWSCAPVNPTSSPNPNVLGTGPSICREPCGNGIKTRGVAENGTRKCDDNNLNDNDGCSSTCQIEDGFTCSSFSYVRGTFGSQCTTITPEQVLVPFLSQAAGGFSTWTVSTDWNNPRRSVCVWYGISCTRGVITTISLPQNNLVGSLPEELTRLTALQRLVLDGNRLSGALPTNLALLSRLEFVSIGSNEYTTISTSLGRLVSITTLIMNSNKLVGTIPSSLFTMTSLTKLDLQNNRLSGSFPQWCPSVSQCVPLTTLTLSGNRLTGVSSISSLITLTQLQLNDNPFATIPSTFGRLTGLVNLNLDNCTLASPRAAILPTTFASLTNLQTLSLKSNAFLGTIPSLIGALSRLTSLDMAKSGINGTLPSQIGKLSGLVTFLVDHNDLQGTIPSQLGKLTELLTLRLDNNRLVGTVPATLANLDVMREFACGANLLIGETPLDSCAFDFAFRGLCDSCAPYRSCDELQSCQSNGVCFARLVSTSRSATSSASPSSSRTAAPSTASSSRTVSATPSVTRNRSPSATGTRISSSPTQSTTRTSSSTVTRTPSASARETAVLFCSCFPGFSGTSCNQCATGYKGDASKNSCKECPGGATNVCSGHGECSVTSDGLGAKCTCSSGFQGTDCATPVEEVINLRPSSARLVGPSTTSLVLLWLVILVLNRFD